MNHKYADLSKKGPNLVDISALRDSILNIINTRVGSIPFFRSFGSKLDDMLFMPYTFSVSRIILSDLVSSINKWDNRVVISPKTNVELLKDQRIYRINLWIEVPGIESDILVLENHDLVSKEKRS